MITEAAVDDAPALGALTDAVYPERVATTAGLRHWIESAPAEAQRRDWKAVVGGRTVGWGMASRQDAAASGREAFVVLLIHPDERGHGVGAALWERIEEHLGVLGPERVICHGHLDDASRRFAERRGFAVASTTEVLSLDPRALPPAPTPPLGVRLAPLAAFAEELATLFAVDREAIQDEPSAHDFGGITFETWQRLTFGSPDFDLDLGLAILADGEVVGTTMLAVDRERGRATNRGTGVLRAYRGRGLATLAKRHSLQRAARVGVTQVTTENDGANAPMLAINRRLGYRPFATRLAWARGAAPS